MKLRNSTTALAALLVTGWHLTATSAQSAVSDREYKIIQSAQFPGSGPIDYVFADADNRKLYVPRGGEILVFDLDTLKTAGSIPNARARGAAVDPKSHHGFSSSSPVVMWDTKTLATIKTIEVKGAPDGILFEPASERTFVFSHSAPNATVLDAKDGSVVGTIDLGGAPEQAASDGKGRLYVTLEDKSMIAVVDVQTMKVIANYSLEGKGGTPAGLGLDAKNGILFAFCRDPQTCVVLSAADGKILATLPIGRGTDGGGFNPATMEAFSSNGDGTLTIIKENSPTSFAVEQTVQTKSRAKTSTLDRKTNRIVLITTNPMPAPADAASPATTPPAAPKDAGATPPAGRRGGGNAGPSFLDILVVG